MNLYYFIPQNFAFNLLYIYVFMTFLFKMIIFISIYGTVFKLKILNTI